MSTNHSKPQLYMRRCFDLAMLGSGKNHRNPRVGALILQGEKIVGEGYHKGFGLAHGEVDAFRNMERLGHQRKGTEEMYISLEPCNHIGKTPPCTQLIERNNVGKITVGCYDPNTEMEGGGIQYLRSKGHQIVAPLLEKDAKSLIDPFAVNYLKHRPYIILKWAETQDGYIAAQGQQTKISNNISDRLVHRWRAHADAIMVGTNTASIDNPQLTCRLYPGNNPIRIVLDRTDRLSTSLNLFDNSAQTIICTEGVTSKNNVEVISLRFDDHLLTNLMPTLLEKGISVLLVEGGAALINSFLEGNLWDECRVLVGNKVLGQGVPAPKARGLLEMQIELLSDQIYQYKNRR